MLVIAVSSGIVVVRNSTLKRFIYSQSQLFFDILRYTYATPTFINKELCLATIQMSLRMKVMDLTVLTQPYQVNLVTCQALPTNNQTRLLTFLLKLSLFNNKRWITCQELLVLKFLDTIPDNEGYRWLHESWINKVLL